VENGFSLRGLGTHLFILTFILVFAAKTNHICCSAYEANRVKSIASHVIATNTPGTEEGILAKLCFECVPFRVNIPSTSAFLFHHPNTSYLHFIWFKKYIIKAFNFYYICIYSKLYLKYRFLII